MIAAHRRGDGRTPDRVHHRSDRDTTPTPDEHNGERERPREQDVAASVVTIQRAHDHDAGDDREVVVEGAGFQRRAAEPQQRHGHDCGAQRSGSPPEQQEDCNRHADEAEEADGERNATYVRKPKIA